VKTLVDRYKIIRRQDKKDVRVLDVYSYPAGVSEYYRATIDDRFMYHGEIVRRQIIDRTLERFRCSGYIVERVSIRIRRK
jgi:hypothetical protein